VKEHPAGRSDVEALVDLWVEKRQQDHFLERVDMMVEPTDCVKVDSATDDRVNVGRGSGDVVDQQPRRLLSAAFAPGSSIVIVRVRSIRFQSK